jgi:hypothetical protein
LGPGRREHAAHEPLISSEMVAEVSLTGVSFWPAGSRGLFLVEMLTNLGAIAEREALFVFAPIKIAGTRGGYGRAVALAANTPGSRP